MNIDNYRTFITLALTENFRQTAEHMNVAQSTVSSRIIELERHINSRLFNRTNRTVKITSAGNALLPYAKKIIELEQKGIEQAQNANYYEDCLRISVPGSVYREKLSPIIDEFCRKYPEYSLDISVHKTSLQLEKLYCDDTDIGFVMSNTNNSKVEFQEYLEYEWILVANMNSDIPDRIEFSDLINYSFSYINQNEAFNAWITDVLPPSYRPRISINSTSQLIQYVKKGFGSAFVPSYSVEDELSSGVIKRVHIKHLDLMRGNVYIAVNKRRKDSTAIRKFLDLIPELDEYKYNIT